MSEAMAARIAGAQLTVLDSAHISVVEQPQAFLDAVCGFVGARCA
jgi:3-oxoadipate enol-lactonase